MKALSRVLDRAATLVVGLVLIGVGAAAFLWERGLIDWPTQPDVAPTLEFLRRGWVPWVAGFGGALLLLVAILWLVAHLGRSRVRYLDPPANSDATGTDLTTIATAAAAELGKRPDVLTCKTKTIRDRGQVVVELQPTLSADADLRAVTTTAEKVATSVHRVVARDDVHVRIAMKVRKNSTARASK